MRRLFSHRGPRRAPRRRPGLRSSPATLVAVGYVLLASAWILLSDWALGALVPPERFRHLQTLKGWLFVAVTGALLWVVLQSYWRARLQAREEQAQSERRLQVGLESLRAILLRFRPVEPFEIVSATGGIASLTGYEPDDLAGDAPRRATELVHPDDRLLVFTAVRASARDGRGFILEFRLLTRSDEPRWVWCKGGPVAEGGAVEMFLTDTSRIKQLEAQLVQSQRLEALTELAAGIAHDVNNLLTAVIGHAELAEQGLRATGATAAAASEHIGEVRRAADRASALNQRLLRLGRPAPAERQDVDLRDILESVSVLLRPVLRRRVSLVCDVPPQPLIVEADPRQLEQVLVNLSLNARDAMPQGGELRLGAAAVEADPPPVGSFHGLPAGRYACLAVSDTGVGIPEDLRERIFEPFFTTKAPEVGTGLGLAVVAALVEEHGGWIAVESAPGEGTTFRIFLPLVSSRERAARSRPEGTSRQPASSPVWSY